MLHLYFGPSYAHVISRSYVDHGHYTFVLLRLASVIIYSSHPTFIERRAKQKQLSERSEDVLCGELQRLEQVHATPDKDDEMMDQVTHTVVGVYQPKQLFPKPLALNRTPELGGIL